MYKKCLSIFFIVIMLTINACNSVKMDMEEIRPQVADTPMPNLHKKKKDK
ncbi:MULTISPECIES: hypothetical protein [Helicobacter]|uniref:Lipoprotein n=1 Tax=Helicobacter bilis WiWa TaxID=1235804 RepID=N2BF84_9HELI|nr:MULTISPECIES: hypothetical protein [Helicobacter]EMZ37203.1 hypothetical protein C826_02200 [Helicobacter bilis WiWa]MDY5951500.1 hypothetical protein [Helicobacter sp.]